MHHTLRKELIRLHMEAARNLYQQCLARERGDMNRLGQLLEKYAEVFAGMCEAMEKTTEEIKTK